jgi:hypothetical protein
MFKELTVYPDPTVFTACPVSVAISNRWGLMAFNASSLNWNDKNVNLIYVFVCYIDRNFTPLLFWDVTQH